VAIVEQRLVAHERQILDLGYEHQVRLIVVLAAYVPARRASKVRRSLHRTF
jgi:hypothetical protein